MAPFYGWWKFLIYVVEAVFAVCLTALTKSKISECKSLKLKILSIIVSTFIILSSITLRIVYEVKVDIAEKDLPSYGTVLVEISYDTDYYTDYSYIGLAPQPHKKSGSHKRKAIIAPQQPAENEAQKRPQSLGQVHQDQSHPNDAEGRLLQMCGNAA